MLENKTILFVDDEMEIIKAIQRALRGEPYRKLFINSAEGAMKILEEDTIHVLVTDMKMPEIDGLTLLKHAQKQYPDIMRLVISGWSQSKILLDAINDGSVYRYILKPWENRELKIIIRQALDVSHLQETNRQLMCSLKSHNFSLEKEVESKTLELIEAKGQALIGKYTSEIADNLKKPLNSLSSELEVLNFRFIQQGIRDKDMSLSMDKVLSSIEDLKKVIAGILVQSRMAKPFHTFPVQLNEIIHELVSLYEVNPVYHNQIDFKLDLSRTLPTFFGNTGQIKQIVDNLLSNAMDELKASYRKDISIKTYVRDVNIVMEITDSGEGILPEHIEHLFSPEGKKFGLASVKTMVDACMGKIEVYSEVGKGSTFTVFLPLSQPVGLT